MDFLNISNNFTLLSQARTGMLGVDLIGSIKDSDIIGQLCLLICTIFSIFSWAVIVYKWRQINRASKQTERFLNKCLKGSGTLEEAYKFTTIYPDSPPAKLLRECYIEAQMENWFLAEHTPNLNDRLTAARIILDRVIEQRISSEIRDLENYLIFLATTASVCPFIGLFGTVWGVLGAFQSVASQGSAAMQAMAPGLSTALSTTVFGLIAAIPASLFFNYFANKNKLLITEMDNFGLEIISIFQKHIIQSTKR